jgi:hypothetical protein
LYAQGPKLKLKQLGSKGWGVLAGEAIKAGSFVAEYTGGQPFDLAVRL